MTRVTWRRERAIVMAAACVNDVQRAAGNIVPTHRNAIAASVGSGANAEFARSAADGAREELKKHSFKVVYDQTYPPPTTDFAPVMRAIQAVNADILYVGAYPPDNVGIIRAANEIGLSPKMFGGAMIGMLVTPIKVQLGPIVNGLIIGENFAAAAAPSLPGSADFLKRYSAKAAAAGIDPLGFALGAVCLCGGPGANGSGGRDQKSRPRQARRLYAQGQVQHRRRQLLICAKPLS